MKNRLGLLAEAVFFGYDTGFIGLYIGSRP
ncbi:putative membrane protein [Bacillus glycinifermentans]|nr:putative membrane protein [Bacillus glycinifermentans]